MQGTCLGFVSAPSRLSISDAFSAAGGCLLIVTCRPSSFSPAAATLDDAPAKPNLAAAAAPILETTPAPVLAPATAVPALAPDGCLPKTPLLPLADDACLKAARDILPVGAVGAAPLAASLLFIAKVGSCDSFVLLLLDVAALSEAREGLPVTGGCPAVAALKGALAVATAWGPESPAGTARPRGPCC